MLCPHSRRVAPSLWPHLDSGNSGSREEGNGYGPTDRRKFKTIVDMRRLHSRKGKTHSNPQVFVRRKSQKGRSHSFRSMGTQGGWSPILLFFSVRLLLNHEKHT